MEKIRIIHNLPRSGGTIISRCFASLPNTIVLSEIHPIGNNFVNLEPIQQAHSWYNLINEEEKDYYLKSNKSFIEKIDFLLKKANSKNKKLIIRDWCYLDYLGKPHIDPSYKNSLYDTLSKKYEILNISILRHPVNTWMSFKALNITKGLYTVNEFLEGYIKYYYFANKFNYYKYEDFCKNPDSILKKMCSNLDIEFNAKYKDLLNKSVSLTGDANARISNEIKKPNRKRFLSDQEKNILLQNEQYQNILKILDYHDEELPEFNVIVENT